MLNLTSSLGWYYVFFYLLIFIWVYISDLFISNYSREEREKEKENDREGTQRKKERDDFLIKIHTYPFHHQSLCSFIQVHQVLLVLHWLPVFLLPIVLLPALQPRGHAVDHELWISINCHFVKTCKPKVMTVKEATHSWQCILKLSGCQVEKSPVYTCLKSLNAKRFKR